MLTNERLLTGMNPEVHRQITAGGEGLAALLANVWLFARVHQHVLVQVASQRKLFGTDVAGVRLVSSVFLNVPVQFVAFGESLVAVVARERFFSRVSPNMRL